MPNNIENRFIETDEIEIRSSEGESDQKYVSGIGVVYNREVEIWDGYKESIRSGAFEGALSSGKEIKSFFNHRADFVLSTTKSDPKLEVEDTPNGLRFKSPIPPTSYGEDLKINLERKNVRGASFSFSVPEDGDIVTRDEKGVYHREIIKADIYEVGPVTNPAYPQTKVGLRSKEDVLKEMEERCKEEKKEPISDINIKKIRLQLIERSI